MHVSYQLHQYLEPVPALDTLQVVVQEVQTVKLLMATATVVMTATHFKMMTAAQMLAAHQVYT